MYREDIELARKARLNACSPYSNYQVGAVLRTKDGKIYTGSNIENDGIQSICAERTAFVKALSEGEREFKSIVVVGGPRNEEVKCTPCGYCRQFIKEYVDDNFKIVVVNDNDIEEYSINDLLPNSFDI